MRRPCARATARSSRRKRRVDERAGAQHHHVGTACEPAGGVAPHDGRAGCFDHECGVLGQPFQIGERKRGLTARIHVDAFGFGVEPADRGDAGHAAAAARDAVDQHRCDGARTGDGDAHDARGKLHRHR